MTQIPDAIEFYHNIVQKESVPSLEACLLCEEKQYLCICEICER